MKKIVVFILCTLALLTLVVPFVAIAEEATGTETTVISETVTEQPNTPYTWEYLATLAGATAATLLIVQFLKVPLDKVWKIPSLHVRNYTTERPAGRRERLPRCPYGLRNV